MLRQAHCSISMQLESKISPALFFMHAPLVMVLICVGRARRAVPTKFRQDGLTL
jgi:hypothetical protein